MKIGLVDLDTSHPGAFVPLLRERGHEVVGVWDGGSVHPSGYAEQFARENQIPKVFETLDGMREEVDCAIIHACDWDTHVEKVRCFLDADKSVLVDKPIAGNAKDLDRFVAWVDEGRRLAGGSALLYCEEAEEWKRSKTDDRGELLTVYGGCGVDAFNYGIHAYAMAMAFVDHAPVKSVRYIDSAGSQDVIELVYENGVRAMLQIGITEAWLPFYGTLVTTRKVHPFLVRTDRIYARFLDAILPFLSGESDVPPLSGDRLVQSERCALAVLISKQSGGRSVTIAETCETSLSYDGSAFAESYRTMKYPDL